MRSVASLTNGLQIVDFQGVYIACNERSHNHQSW